MSVIDKFLNAINIKGDDFEEEEYYDDEAEEYEDEAPRKRILPEREEYDDESDTYEYEEEEPASSTSSRRSPFGSISSRKNSSGSSSRSESNSRSQDSSRSKRRKGGNTGGMEVCVIRPHTMEDAHEITETLLDGCTVLLNLEGLEYELAQRVVDFTSGSCYAINGNLQKITTYIFVITPSSVNISGDFQELLSGAFDVPFEKRI